MRVVAGKVRLTDRIATGGMGEVWRAVHLVTGADVAVKVLEPTVAALADEDVRERFRHEARISAVLAHRCIVRVFDMLEEKDGTLALVMELLCGETLEQRLAKRPLDVEEAVAIAHSILGALSHAHAVGIVHRDVKPANIFLAVDPDGRITPKLLDFGVAKTQISTVKTRDGDVLGTARYMSPEQVRGEELDGRSDQWSIATILYESITGHCPFDGADDAAILSSVLGATVDPDDKLPPKIWLAIVRALSKRSYERFESTAAFAQALLEALGISEDELPRLSSDDKPPLPRLETRGEFRPVVAPARPVSRLRLWMTAVVVLGLGLVAFLALPVTRSTPPKTIARAVVEQPLSIPEPTIQPSAAPSAFSSAVIKPHPLPSAIRKHDVATTPGF